MMETEDTVIATSCGHFEVCQLKGMMCLKARYKNALVAALGALQHLGAQSVPITPKSQLPQSQNCEVL